MSHIRWQWYCHLLRSVAIDRFQYLREKNDNGRNHHRWKKLNKIQITCLSLKLHGPLVVGIRVRIRPSVNLACHIKGSTEETAKTEVFSQQMWHDKDPFILKGRIGGEHIDQNFYSPYKAMVMSPMSEIFSNRT